MRDSGHGIVARRIARLLATIALVPALVGCAQHTSTRPSAHPRIEVGGSVTAGTLVMSVSIPSAYLAASSFETATVTVENSANSTSSEFVVPVIDIVIVDSAGKKVHESLPPSAEIPFPGTMRLAPYDTWSSAQRFEVPQPGAYRLEARNLMVSRFRVGPWVPFRAER